MEEILALDSQSWEEKADSIYEEDKEISRNFVKQAISHYAIKYNPFVGIISEYFTTED